MELFLLILGCLAAALFKDVFPTKKKKDPNQASLDAWAENYNKFTTAVIDKEKLVKVRKIIADGYIHPEVVEAELKPVFEMFPELAGQEKHWQLSSKKSWETNRNFIDPILYFKYGCMPITYTGRFSMRGYITDIQYDTVFMVTLSAQSRETFMRWAENKMMYTGAHARLEYDSTTGMYEWKF